MRSLWIREQIATHAGTHGYGFIDVTESMKASAKSNMLHGPKDWKHPNRLGYQVVRDAILTARGESTVERGGGVGPDIGASGVANSARNRTE